MMHISYDFLQNIFEIDSFHRVLFFINTKNTEKNKKNNNKSGTLISTFF